MKRLRRCILGVVLVGAMMMGPVGCTRSHDRGSSLDGSPIHTLPGTVVWAWERAEDLRTIDPATTAIAMLESWVHVGPPGPGPAGPGPTSVEARPRHHPLRAPDDARLLGVVRIEVVEGTSLDLEILDVIVEAVLRHHSVEDTVGLQIDFDARRSERDAYRGLLETLRQRLPASHGLSMTALASWCLGDNWLEGLPVDEAVPMLFSMGRDAETVRSMLASGVDFSSPPCRTSVGLATNQRVAGDARWVALTPSRRRYVFHPRAWDTASLEALRSAR